MKETSKARRAGVRAVIALAVVSAIECLIPGGKLSASFPAANVSNRTLTFTHRVACQRAIEEVYWRHRFWPKENPGPKPSFDAVISRAGLEKKVRDYLRESQALGDYWQRPITAEQLQGEIDRMAEHTKQPEVLRELFEALGNDPFVIAECLARPALAERLLSKWYACDQRIHGDLKKRAEAELRAHPTVKLTKQLSAEYGEVELIRSDGSKHPENRGNAEGSTKLSSREWGATVEKLATMFNKRDGASGSGSETRRQVAAGLRSANEIIPIGKLSPLQEDETHFSATAIMKKTADRLTLATVTWSKESLESWIAQAESQMPEAMVIPSAVYTLPRISDRAGGCDDTWMATAIPSTGRYRHTAVWTGSEMIVWGGGVAFNVFSNTGERYTPSTDSWGATSTVNAPTNRADLTAVWTGTEMILWGGDTPGVYFNTGGRYNPASDGWASTSTSNAPHAREKQTAVWTGSEMIVWGGYLPGSACHRSLREHGRKIQS